MHSAPLIPKYLRIAPLICCFTISIVTRADTKTASDNGERGGLHTGAAAKDHGELDQLLDSTLIRHVSFRDVTARQFVDFVINRAREDPRNKFYQVNFVYAAENNQRISLTISNAPLRDVLYYGCKLSGLTYKVERNALIFMDGIDHSGLPASEASGESNPIIERKLDEIMIERLNLVDAYPVETLDFLRGLSITQDKKAKDPKEAGINVIIASTGNFSPVTFNASNLTLREALHYTCIAAKLSFRVERSAIFVAPADDPFFAQEEHRSTP